RELEMLQFGNQQHEADPSIVEISKIREELVEKKRLEETNLARLSNHMTVTKKQVEQYQSLIDEVDDKLRRVQPQTQKLTDADKQIISKILSSTIGRTQNVEVAKTLNQLAASLEQSG
ncbi:MAG TPA: hypothetical protein VLF17_07415, partial [Candidatus Nitrosotenuis sp.]|nr:hypothetical protein [Candidatus Nitrosotenuis sp.]